MSLCDNNPCKNNAYCEMECESVDEMKCDYTCLCQKGFIGRNCNYLDWTSCDIAYYLSVSGSFDIL